MNDKYNLFIDNIGGGGAGLTNLTTIGNLGRWGGTDNLTTLGNLGRWGETRQPDYYWQPETAKLINERSHFELYSDRLANKAMSK